MSSKTGRTASVERKTRESDVRVEIDLDGSGEYEVTTGIPFFDHMLQSFARHSLFDLRLTAKGDLDFHPAVAEIGPRRDEGIALDGAVSEQFFEFPFVQQEPPGAFRIQGACLRILIGANIAVV